MGGAKEDTRQPAPHLPARVEDGSSWRALWEQGDRAREVRPPPKHHPLMLPQDSPVPQARDAYQLDDIDPYLTKKYEEEHKEAERVVGPEGLIDGSVPTKEGTGGEDDKPQDGKAEVHSLGAVD